MMKDERPVTRKRGKRLISFHGSIGSLRTYVEYRHERSACLRCEAATRHRLEEARRAADRGPVPEGSG